MKGGPSCKVVTSNWIKLQTTTTTTTTPTVSPNLRTDSSSRTSDW